MEENIPKDKKFLILAVEDDVFIADVHRKKLAKEGYEVVLATNGQEAMNFVKQRKPDLILLDLIMPVMDGFETLKELKAAPNLKDIKVIILSNLSQEEDKKNVLKMGALDYIVKADVSFREILDLIKHHLGI
jgi:CheY-like chemotaxis protein